MPGSVLTSRSGSLFASAEVAPTEQPLAITKIAPDGAVWKIVPNAAVPLHSPYAHHRVAVTIVENALRAALFEDVSRRLEEIAADQLDAHGPILFPTRPFWNSSGNRYDPEV